MDVKNAFLQGELEEEVFMAPPQGYDASASQVCKLRKAIYGLKQSPRAWYQKLSTCLLDKEFVRSEADHTLFTKKGKEGLVAILIYVDDIIVTGDDVEGINKTKDMLKSSFDIKDLGELKYFLGIEMTREPSGMFISQKKYVLDLLKETGKLGSKPAKTPIEDGYKDVKDGSMYADVKQYQRLVGKLIYLTITRPDVCFAVNRVSQHMQAPMNHHWNMVERILRYLKGNPGKGIWLKCNGSTRVEAYCDADWAGDKLDRKSTTGYCTLVGSNLVTWRSKKQKVIALSSAEAEYRAMKEVTKEMVWLKALIGDLGIHDEEPMSLYCDNQAAIHIASNPVFHERTKHIEVDCHFVRAKIQEGLITPMFVRSEDQMADIFTKAATSSVCEYVHSKIGLWDPMKPTLKGSVENDTRTHRSDCPESTSGGLSQFQELGSSLDQALLTEGSPMSVEEKHACLGSRLCTSEEKTSLAAKCSIAQTAEPEEEVSATCEFSTCTRKEKLGHSRVTPLSAVPSACAKGRKLPCSFLEDKKGRKLPCCFLEDKIHPHV